ncbi:MAG: DUF3667 domain-containing protein [Pseudomonadales bacterium]|nr:DUF3667 domain-containing protein [Pseudomonadales bacterium]
MAEQSPIAGTANTLPDSPHAGEHAGTCPNCHATLYGRWCFACGQSQKPIDRFFFTLVAEAFDDVFSFDSRTARTLFALLFRPGFLTVEYFAGRRARYVPPLRLYLIASVVFFFVLSVEDFVSEPGSLIHPNGIYIDGDDIDPADMETLKNAKATGDIKAIEDFAAAKAQEKTQAEAQANAQTNGQADVQATADGKTKSGDAEWQVELAKGIDEIQMPFDPGTATAIKDRLKLQFNKAGKMLKDDPGGFIAALIDVAPPVMFLLLPLFAIVLKVVYFTSGKYYTQHLVLAVHNHSFMFVILIFNTFIILAEDTSAIFGWLRTAIQAWIPIYLFLSLRTVYREGWFLTFVKFCVLGIFYNVLFIFGLLTALLLGVMSL